MASNLRDRKDMSMTNKANGRQGVRHGKGDRQAKGEHDNQGVWQEKGVASNPSDRSRQGRGWQTRGTGDKDCGRKGD
jgi:hypothetical protein